MRKKIEIKVYLPYLMVGELESRRKNNVRSKFIEEAIRSRLDGEQGFTLADEETLEILAELRYRKDLPQWFLNQLDLVRKELEE
jgi:metal-responsive CopG/Arc/MetJ family transcriptional regulator